MEQTIHYMCPVCGYDKLEARPYKNVPSLAETRNKKPPYASLWGMGSYEVCTCRGFEFGNDDDGMDGDDNSSFESYLADWVQEEKCRWFEPEKKPSGWSIVEQLKAAGLAIPEYLTKPS